MPSIDSVQFDDSSYHLQVSREDICMWCTPADDSVALYFFALPPDIAADLRSIHSVRRFYGTMLAEAGAAIVELDITCLDGCTAVRQIIKKHQEDFGKTYIGSLRLPFRDFSFVIKAQCLERRITGTRDAVILAEALSDGRVTINHENKQLMGSAETITKGFTVR
jgi:hypothetical protein